MFRKRKAQQEMEEISRMLERVLNGECIQPGEIGYEDTLPAKIRYQIRRISEKNQGVEARITRERDETKALIGEIAHQMRNPLAGVESYTQLLEGEISGEPGRTYLRALEQSEQRLHFLTESFIKMARLEQQMIQIKKTTDALADTIFSAVLLVQKAAEEKQMEVEVTGAEETKVWHDGNWLGEAVYNLLDNSVKYAPEHSKIRVVVQQDEMYRKNRGIRRWHRDSGRRRKPDFSAVLPGKQSDRRTGIWSGTVYQPGDRDAPRRIHESKKKRTGTGSIDFSSCVSSL